MLVDFDQIKALTFGSQPATFDQSSVEIEPIIIAVIDSVKKHINRPLERGTYKQFGALDPVHRVIVTPFASIVPDFARSRGTEITFSEPLDEFEYEGGWTQQTLPYDIRQVIFRLVAYEFNQAIRNVYGTASKTVVSGSTTATITKEDNGVYPRELAKLDKYKNMNFYSWVERVDDAIPDNALLLDGQELLFEGQNITFTP